MRSPDSDLLRRYAETRDETAFAEFVGRRIDGIYAAARRRVGGDAHLAEDVTQQVFVTAARQAHRLAGHPDLTGWLYTTARHSAANLVRTERRWRAREQLAHTMSDESDSLTIDWTRVAPVLDDAIEQLGVPDRTAILLRFVERRAFAEIGVALRVSEDAARMRVGRALDRLRTLLERRGIASTAAALGAALATSAAGAAPAALSGAVIQAALAAGTSVSATGTLGGFLLMNKLKLGIAAVAFVAAGTLAVRDLRASRSLEQEIRELQQAQASLVDLRTANTRLANSLATVAPANPLAAEIGAVRERAAQLKARPVGVTDAGLQPIDIFQNRGWQTPLAAFETQLWARASGNMDEFARAFGWTPSGKAKIDRFFAALPETVRTRYGTPERMLAPDAAKWGSYGHPTAIQILGSTDYGDAVVVHAWGRLGMIEFDHFQLETVGGGGLCRCGARVALVDVGQFDVVTGDGLDGLG